MKLLPNVSSYSKVEIVLIRWFLDDQLSAIRMISLDRKEAEEFYEVYRDVVAEYAQMVNNFKIISIYNYFTG